MSNRGGAFRLNKIFFKSKMGIYLSVIAMALLDILVIFWIMRTYHMI